MGVGVGLNEITPRFVRILREFAPFGPANMRPAFLTRNVEIAGVPRIVGKNHLRFKARQNGTVFDAINEQGDYLGRAIAPGIGIASEALFSRGASSTG